MADYNIHAIHLLASLDVPGQLYVQSSSMCNNEKFRCKLSCKTVTMAEVTAVSLQVRSYVRSFVWLVRSVDPFEQFALDSFDLFD